MRRLVTSEILEGIRRNDPQVLHYVYQTYFKKVVHFVTSNSGTSTEASDVFQEALIVVFQRVRKEGPTLTRSFRSFFLGVIRNLWLKQLEARRRTQFQELSDSGDIDVFQVRDDLYSAYDEALLRQLIHKYFNGLSEQCRTILELYARKMSVKDIAEQLGLTENFVKKRKYECKEKLIRDLMNDPLFKHIFNHERMGRKD
ncbi:MAG: RNA polymerase sigma factor [Bacteroidales bacterium]